MLVNLLADIKEKLPKWTRIQRIQRDIPVQLIEAGSQKSHIRELAQWELEARGTKCNCIRCREAGHNYLKGREPDEISLLTQEYQASGGKEYFISFEDVEANIIYSTMKAEGRTRAFLQTSFDISSQFGKFVFSGNV